MRSSGGLSCSCTPRRPTSPCSCSTSRATRVTSDVITHLIPLPRISARTPLGKHSHRWRHPRRAAAPSASLSFSPPPAMTVAASTFPTPSFALRLPPPSPSLTSLSTPLLHATTPAPASHLTLGSPPLPGSSTAAAEWERGRGASPILLTLHASPPPPLQSSALPDPSVPPPSRASASSAAAGGRAGAVVGVGGAHCAFLSSSQRFSAAASATPSVHPSSLSSSSCSCSSLPLSSSFFPSASPSFSRVGFGVGFASCADRFPRTRRRSPGPVAEWTALQQPKAEEEATAAHHWALASAAFHVANHDGQHLPPRPSRPRTAPACTRPTAPSVPFLSPYHTRTANPPPTRYQPDQSHTSLHPTSSAGLSTAARETSLFLVSPSSSPSSPSPTSYDPQLSTVRPRPSTAASTHFASLAERDGQLTATTVANGARRLASVGQADDCGHHEQGGSALHVSYSLVHRPYTATLPSVPSSSFHPPQLPVDRWGRAASSLSSSSPSPLSYRTDAAFNAVTHSAPAHSFASPTRAAGGARERQSLAVKSRSSWSGSGIRALSVEEEGGHLSGHRSFLFNHRQLYAR